jgi:hypothetical protein
MFKVVALMVAAVILMSFGLYSLSIAEIPALHLPAVNWGLVGFVTIVASVATFGSAFVVSRLN